MPKRPTPEPEGSRRRRAQFAASFAAATVETLDFAALERAANVTFDETARPELVRIADRYLSDLAEQRARPRARDVRRSLETLEKDARERLI
ncbi:MAG TPA: hypothetical protein VKA19_09125 [Alphaproteobacteria bacterium]|nr:hypothetical protein [Alphaproteobacteria bacterium]